MASVDALLGQDRYSSNGQSRIAELFGQVMIGGKGTGREKLVFLPTL